MDTAFAISGFLAPVITGWVVGTFGSFLYAFLLMAALALSSVLVVLFFHRPDEDRGSGGRFSPGSASGDAIDKRPPEWLHSLCRRAWSSASSSTTRKTASPE